MIAITVAVSKSRRKDALDFRNICGVQVRDLPIAEMIRRSRARDWNDVIALRQNPCERRAWNCPTPPGAEVAKRRKGTEIG